MRRFAVIGLGSFGIAAARTLARLGEHVLAIDSDHEPVEALKDEVAAAVVTDASQADNLAALEIQRTDVAIVSLSAEPYASTLVTLHLVCAGVPTVIAKALSADHGEVLRRVGATRVIFPESDRAARLAARLTAAHVLDYLAFSPNLGVLEISPPTQMFGQSLGALALGRRFQLQVIAVRELVPERSVVSPRADFVVKPSDVLLVMGSPTDVARLQEAYHG